jgi:hypothetical protein
VQRPDPASSPDRQDAPLAGAERQQVDGDGAVQRFQCHAGDPARLDLQQPLCRRVGQRHPAVEVEDDDPGRRLAQHQRQEMLLLLQLDALAAKRVDHPVVDVDQAVQIWLAHLAHARHEVAVLEQPGTLAHELDRLQEAPDQRQAAKERDEDDGFDSDQPPAVSDDHEGRHQPHEGVHRDEIEDEPGAQAHTGISYFSSRR